MKNNTKDLYDVIIIGGGASGMYAGVTASTLGKKVLIIEKNKNLGEKLKITGGGRCNITNDEEDIRVFLENYGKAKDGLFSPFAIFSKKDTFKYFTDHGLPLVVQARKRAFPHTEKAYDVYRVLEQELIKNKVEILSNTTVKKILFSNGHIDGVETNKGIHTAHSYILSTGGMSHKETGSTGDGFVFLRDLGHKVKDPTPSIVPLEVADSWVHMLAGVSLSFMKITFYLEDKKQFSKTGKILFTHFGLSGPLILNTASKVHTLLQSGKVTALIDAYPDTNHGALEERIIKIFDSNKNKNLRTVFREICPLGTNKALEYLLSSDGGYGYDIDFDTKVHSVKKDDRKKIVQILKALPIQITNLMGYDRAVVADGGVTLSEIDTKTMRSKLYNNLFITGDLLDIMRPSGGYSLQICWTSGYIAGKNC